MLSFIKKIFRDQTLDWPISVSDPVIGELKLSDDADWWEAKITAGEKMIGFKIGGNGKPDPRLIAHAHDIIRSLSEFERLVAAFLADEARTNKSLVRFAEEIAQLTIEDIYLFWPKRPDDGMICFTGPDKFRVWRCDYVGRKLQGLGFDI